jgi:hypothetical protein
MNPTKREYPPATPAEETWITVSADRIDLVKPHIWLQGGIVMRNGPAIDVLRELMPERAYIAHGVLVVEELNLWLPLASVHVGRKDKP